MDRVVIAEVADASVQGVAQAGLDKMVAWRARHGVTRDLLRDGDRCLLLSH